MSTDLSTLVLSHDQDVALNGLLQFALDPTKQICVLEGYAGCGKSTLMSVFIDRLPYALKTLNLMSDAPVHDLLYTATTHKACNNLAGIIDEPVQTIHSALGLFVRTDFQSGKTQLCERRNFENIRDTIIVVDEASQVDHYLLEKFFTRTENCKFILMGDPSQLLAVNCSTSPVFSAGFETFHLKEIMRQVEGNPIIQASTLFRNTVNTGEWGNVAALVDGQNILHLNSKDWQDMLLADMTAQDWKFYDSKALAFTNERVRGINSLVRMRSKGSPEICVGDLAVVNSFVSKGNTKLATDSLVEVHGISDIVEEFDTQGKYYSIGTTNEKWFMPLNKEDFKRVPALMRKQEDYQDALTVEREWVDLRAAYASTVHKSQGSTYDRAYIDLSDISRCRNWDTIARMCYVATSRARHQVIFTGDLG